MEDKIALLKEVRAVRDEMNKALEKEYKEFPAVKYFYKPHLVKEGCLCPTSMNILSDGYKSV